MHLTGIPLLQNSNPSHCETFKFSLNNDKPPTSIIQMLMNTLTNTPPHHYRLGGIVVTRPRSSDRLDGLVVMASASRAEDPGFESRLCRDFSGSSHTSDSKIDTPVATLPGAWRHRVSTGTGRPGVSIL